MGGASRMGAVRSRCRTGRWNVAPHVTGLHRRRARHGQVRRPRHGARPRPRGGRGRVASAPRHARSLRRGGRPRAEPRPGELYRARGAGARPRRWRRAGAHRQAPRARSPGRAARPLRRAEGRAPAGPLSSAGLRRARALLPDPCRHGLHLHDRVCACSRAPPREPRPARRPGQHHAQRPGQHRARRLVRPRAPRPGGRNSCLQHNFTRPRLWRGLSCVRSLVALMQITHLAPFSAPGRPHIVLPEYVA